MVTEIDPTLQTKVLPEAVDLPSPDPDYIDGRIDLVNDIEEQVVKEGLSSKKTQERLNLLKDVLSNEDLDEAKKLYEVISGSLESVTEKSLAALESLAEATGYSAAYMLARNKAESPTVHTLDELVQLAGFADSEVNRTLAKTWQLIYENPDSALAKVFNSDFMPEIIRETNSLAQSALDTVNFLNSPVEKSKGWVKDQFEKHPMASASVLALGAVGLGALVYRTIRKRKAAQPVQNIETGSGESLLKRTRNAMAFLPHALWTVGGLSIAGMILGTEQVQDTLEKHLTGNLSFIPKTLYQRRIPATFIHLCSGRPVEAIATMGFGPRDSKEKMRHDLYAKYFGVKETAVWAVSGLTLEKLLDASPDRKYPVSGGFLNNIPFLNTMIAESGLRGVEDSVRSKFIAKMGELTKLDPAIKTKTVDEATKIAFAEGIFDPLDQVIEDDDSPQTEAVKSSINDFNKNVDALVGVETFGDKQIEALRSESENLHIELDELRLAIPGEFDYLKMAFSRAFPVSMVESTEDLVGYEDTDLMATQDFYEEFAQSIKESDQSAIRSDLDDLEAAQAYFVNLRPGQKPDETSRKHVETLKRINQRLRTWKLRAEQSRHQSVEEDDEHWNTPEDMAEILSFYYLGYTGIPHYLEWSFKTIKDPESGLSNKFAAVSMGVGATALSINSAIALYQVTHGRAIAGLCRMVVPGPQLGYEALTFARNFGHLVGYNTPETLLRKVALGKMSSEEAVRLSKIALKHSDKFTFNKSLTTRMSDYEGIISILDDNADDIARFMDDPSLVQSLDRGEFKWAWEKQLRNLVKERFNQTLEEFFTKAHAERATQLSESISPAKIANMINRLARRLNLREIPYDDLVRILSREGPVFSFTKLMLSRGARYGLPIGVSLISAYFACEVVYTGDHDKAEKFAMLGTGIIAAELAVTFGRSAEGAALAAKISKNPYVIAIGAILGLVGVTVAAEALIEPYLKTRNPLGAGLIGAFSSSMYMGSAGWVIDRTMHQYYDKGAKEYFMRTTVLPVAPWRWKEGGEVHMAFKDGGVGYYDEKTPDQAIAMFNNKTKERIDELNAKTPENDEDRAEIQAEIQFLSSQVIDEGWEVRQTTDFDSKKVNIKVSGIELEKQIFEAYGERLSVRERALVSSLLTVDAPHSWLDEDFLDIDDEPRVALIRRLTNESSELSEAFDQFIAYKRDIQSDVQFYQLIEKDDEIVDISEEKKTDRLMKHLGVNYEQLVAAESIFNDFTSELDFEIGLEPKAQAA